MKITKETTFLITGGCSGLGSATAVHMYQLGAKVAVLDLQPPKDNTPLHRILQQDTERTLYKHCNVLIASEIDTALEAVVAKFGSIHVVLNCAGIAVLEPLLNVKTGKVHSLELFQKVIGINTIGTFAVLSKAAAYMTKQETVTGADGGRGVIINVSSVAAFDSTIGSVAYGVSKGAVVSMALPIARDLAEYGIRCVTLCPGYFDTAMTEASPQKLLHASLQYVPFPKRMGVGPEFSSMVQSIVENEMINGEHIRLDGAFRVPFISRL